MPVLREFRDRFIGKRVTMIGGAVTTVDYEDLAAKGTDVVVFLNWALRIAPLFEAPRHELFFFTWHMEIFRKLPELRRPNIRIAAYDGCQCDLPQGLAIEPLRYEAGNIIPYQLYRDVLELWAIKGYELIEQSNLLPSCANTTLLALMFLWYAGCREIDCVGMHDIGGTQSPHYDLRLQATNPPGSAACYMQCQNDFAKIMRVKLNYIEDVDDLAKEG